MRAPRQGGLVAVLLLLVLLGLVQGFVPRASSTSRQTSTTPLRAATHEPGHDRRTWLQTAAATASLLLGVAGSSAAVQAAPLDPAYVSDPIFPNVTEPAFTTTCFLEFASDKKKFGRVEVSLYGEVCPQTVANFVALCKEGYKGSNVYRVLRDFSIQMGDIGSKKRGATGRSSLAGGAPFPKETLRVQHSLEGMLSMVNDKTGQVDSRFFINLGRDAGWADGRYVAFGRVTKGLEVLKELEKVDVKPPSNVPAPPVLIADAGVVS